MDPDKLFEELARLREVELPSFGELEDALRAAAEVADEGMDVDGESIWRRIDRDAPDAGGPGAG